MPEGDTIHTLARAMAPLLVGERLADLRVRGDSTLQLTGRVVESVEARGKHLSIRLQGDLVLRTHLGMTGSWHRYAPGEAWKRPRTQASVTLATQDEVFVCFNAQEVECVRAGGTRHTRAGQRLGPDLVAEEDPDLDFVLTRARTLVLPEAPLVDVLLHQGVACGIGNVYKAEVLFLHRVHPLQSLEVTEDELLRALYESARKLLRSNLGGGRRVTRHRDDGSGRLWVYGRAGKPCHTCGAQIERDILGARRRVTTWCPACQAQ